MLDDDDDRNDALTIITHYYQFADGDDNIDFFSSTWIPQFFMLCSLCSAELQLVTDVPTYFIWESTPAAPTTH